MLGSPLGDAVGRARLKLVEGAVVCLGDVSDHRRLRPVDSSGAQEEHSLYATSRREIQSVTRAIYDGAEQVQRSAARARSSENRVAEFAFGKRECAHIARMQQQTWISSRTRIFLSKFSRIACQHSHTCIELQLAIGVQKACNQPLTKKAGAA